MPDGESSTEIITPPPQEAGASPGEAKKLIERTQAYKKEHLVLFSEVPNKVLIVNPAIVAPFALKEGEQSNLGMFAQDSYVQLEKSERTTPHPRGEKYGEYWKGHDRSTIIARVLFRDGEGRLYRDVDLKGVGWLNHYRQDKEVRVLPPGKSSSRAKPMGMMSLEEAMADYQNSEDFLQAGIRTSRTIAIIEIKQIIRMKTDNPEAREYLFGDENSVPVIEVRAFGTKARLSDLNDYGEKTRANLIEDAKKLIAQELGREELTDQEYIDWLIDTLGRSVGLIHKNGWIHGGLRDHNITLDGRIVDLDTVESSVDSKKRAKEIGLITWELGRLKTDLTREGSELHVADFREKIVGKVKERFMEKYYEAFSRARKTKVGELLKAA